MARGVLGRLTYANVTASIALFIALGGTSYAAVNLPRNSVGAKHLRSESVRSSEVRDGSLEARDLSRRARAALRRQPVSAGTQGPSATPQGSPAVTRTGDRPIVYKAAAGRVPVALADDTSIAAGSVSCDAGQQVTGGGVKLENSYEMYVADAYPEADGRTWTVHVGNDDDTAGRGFTVYAICSP